MNKETLCEIFNALQSAYGTDKATKIFYNLLDCVKTDTLKAIGQQFKII